MQRAWLAVVSVVTMGCSELLDIGHLRDVDDATADVGADAGVDAPDDVCVHPNGPCSPFPQCGCQPGRNCEIYTTAGATECLTIGTHALWDACDNYGECPLGATCMGGACKPFCDTAADCVGTNVTCEQIRNPPTPSGQIVPGLKVCSSGCDPMNPHGICGPSATCGPAPWDGLGQDHGDCFGPAGTAIGPDASTCTGQDLAPSCAAGYYCTTNHDCAQWCRVNHDADCKNGRLCVPFLTPPGRPIISGVEYGICAD